MNQEQQNRWQQLRMTIVLSQLGPTFLLISTIALLQFGLADTSLATRWATAGILLASGILGAFVQFTAASEASALAKEVRSETPSEHSVVRAGSWMWVVKFVTPSVFVGIYAALMVALFL